MRKKILFLITQGELGGAQRYVFDMATAIADRRGSDAYGNTQIHPEQNQRLSAYREAANPHVSANYEVVVAQGAEDLSLKQKLDQAGIRTAVLPHLIRAISPYNDLLAVKEIQDLIKKEKPDIVHTNSTKAGLLGSWVAYRMKVPKVIFTAHGWVFNEPGILRPLYLLAEKFGARHKTKIICVSEYDRQTALKYGVGRPEQLVTIHNGIEHVTRNAYRVTKEEARTQLSKLLGEKIDQDDIVVGTIAHDYKTKDLPTLYKAFEIIADRRGSIAPSEHTRIQTDNELLYADITYKIRGACFKVWKELRGAFKEKAVERALMIELENSGLAAQTQVKIPIKYGGNKVAEYVPDMVVEDKVLIELKSKPVLTKEDQKQFWLYLKGSPYKLGLLINFGNKLEIIRRIHDLSKENNQRVSAYREADNPRVSANIKLVVIGKGSKIGQIPNAASFLPAFDIYAISSVKEGLPYSLLEAISAGLPVVATKVGGIPEVITDGKEGFLVEPKNPQMLADALVRLSSDKNLRETMSANALQKANEFSLQKMLSEVLNIYNN